MPYWRYEPSAVHKPGRQHYQFGFGHLSPNPLKRSSGAQYVVVSVDPRLGPRWSKTHWPVPACELLVTQRAQGSVNRQPKNEISVRLSLPRRSPIRPDPYTDEHRRDKGPLDVTSLLGNRGPPVLIQFTTPFSCAGARVFIPPTRFGSALMVDSFPSFSTTQ